MITSRVPQEPEPRPGNRPRFSLLEKLWSRLNDWRWQPTGPIKGSPGNTVCLVLALAFVYFAVGYASIWAAGPVVGVNTHIFYAEGVALALAIIFGPRVAPGVLLGQLALAHTTSPLPIEAGVLIALTKMGVVALGAHLFWRFRISPQFRNVREVGLFVGLITLVLQPISASAGIAVHFFFEAQSALYTPTAWLLWWLSNTLGQLLIAPLILTILSEPFVKTDLKEFTRSLVVVSLYLIPLFLFTLGGWEDVSTLPYLLLQVTFYLPLIALAVRGRPRTVALGALLLTEPFIYLAHAGIDISGPILETEAYLVSSLVVVSGIVTALLISALRKQVAEKNKQLHAAIHAHERLLAVIGHDLRGPLAIVSNFMDLMIEGDLSEEEFREVQQDLRKSLDQATSILANLMEWAEAQISEEQHTVAELELRTHVEEVINCLSFTAQSKEIDIRNMIPSGAAVLACEHQVRAVLRNLLSNALKFSSRNSEVTVTAKRIGDVWETHVLDQGVGMKSEQAANLFHRENEFSTSRGTENERGIGLGLQICREFIRANKGTIEAASQEGGGTRIRFTLPAADPVGSKPTGDSQPLPEPSSGDEGWRVTPLENPRGVR